MSTDFGNGCGMGCALARTEVAHPATMLSVKILAAREDLFLKAYLEPLNTPTTRKRRESFGRSFVCLLREPDFFCCFFSFRVFGVFRGLNSLVCWRREKKTDFLRKFVEFASKSFGSEPVLGYLVFRGTERIPFPTCGTPESHRRINLAWLDFRPVLLSP
jgi:hypothetical protein